MRTTDLKTDIDSNKLYTRTYNYKIRNDFSLSSYSDDEILKVLKSDLEEYEKGQFVIENDVLKFKNRKYIDRAFKDDGFELIAEQMRAKLWPYDSGYFKIINKKSGRVIQFCLNNKSLKIYSTIGIIVIAIFITLTSIYWSKSLTETLINISFVIAAVLFFYGIVEIIYLMQTKSTINEIIMREENRINNEL